MATLTISNSFVAGTDALASEVNQNFTDVKNFVNSQVVHRDGTTAFTSTPSMPSTAAAVTAAGHVSNKAYVDDRRWNTAWGAIQVQNKTTGQIISTATVDVSGLSITFTAVAGRRYRVQGHFWNESDTATLQLCVVRITDGSNTTLSTHAQNLAGLNLSYTGSIIVYTTPSAGQVTYKLRASTTEVNGFELKGSATAPAILSVEDVGPA